MTDDTQKPPNQQLVLRIEAQTATSPAMANSVESALAERSLAHEICDLNSFYNKYYNGILPELYGSTSSRGLPISCAEESQLLADKG